MKVSVGGGGEIPSVKSPLTDAKAECKGRDGRVKFTFQIKKEPSGSEVIVTYKIQLFISLHFKNHISFCWLLFNFDLVFFLF